MQESIQAVREISSNLHPHHLDRLGFVSAVEAMTDNIARTTGLCVHNSLEKIDVRLRKETEIHVYRIIQEALTNVVRHAQAKNVSVTLRAEQRTLELVIVDDGKGFQPGETAKQQEPTSPADSLSGFGLASMSERARIIGAKLQIESSPGNGTVVRVTLSLDSGGNL
jgi:signal transduction histidine kinase